MLDFAPGLILSGGSLPSATRVAGGLSLIRDLDQQFILLHNHHGRGSAGGP